VEQSLFTVLPASELNFFLFQALVSQAISPRIFRLEYRGIMNGKSYQTISPLLSVGDTLETEP